MDSESMDNYARAHTHEALQLKGKCVMRAWKKGVIEKYLEQGLELEDAQMLAHAEGALIGDPIELDNLIVTVGRQMVGDLLIDVVTTGLTYHAIGTDDTAPAAGDTTLNTEAERKSITTRSRAGAVVSLSTFFTSAESTYNIKECGIFGDAASGSADSGTLFSRYLLAYDNSGGSVDLTFDYTLTIS